MGGILSRVVPRDEAISLVLEAAGSLDLREGALAEELPPERAWGLLSFGDLVSPEDVPPAPRSLRDGVALRSEDVAGASPSSPAYLELVGEVPMGVMPSFSLRRGQACRIWTGGFLPEGADAVAMEEEISLEGGWVEVRKALSPFENVSASGEDVRAGSPLLARGSLVRPFAAGAFAALGLREVGLFAVPCCVISTGDELVPAGEDPPPGRIRDSNGPMLEAVLSWAGLRVLRRLMVEDCRSSLEEAVRECLSLCRLVFVSGGSSAGARDLTASVLDDLGPPGLLVHGLAVRPGKPTLVGLNERGLVFGLPGHPLSCLVAVLTFALPVVRSLLAGRRVEPPILRGRVLGDVVSSLGVEEFVPASLEGGLGVRPLPAKSGFVGVMAAMDCLIRLGPEVEGLFAGDEAEVVLPW